MFSITTLCNRCLKNVSGHILKRTFVTESIWTQTFSKYQINRFTRRVRIRPAATYTLLSIYEGASGIHQRSLATSIQKHISPLLSKRPMRKKTKVQSSDEVATRSVIAYSVAEEYDLESIHILFNAQGLYSVVDIDEEDVDALYVKAKYNVDDNIREIFFFREGSVVFWNMPELERTEILKFVRPYTSEAYKINLTLHECETLNVIHSRDRTALISDTIHLKLEDAAISEMTDHLLLLQKYSFSNALSLSVKLGIWEASLETFVESLEPLTNDLRRGHRQRISRRQLLQKTGELFTLRHLINLSSDLLDTPDFYWDRADLEAHYIKTCSHLNISRRTRVMNEKLNHCCELVDLLSGHLNDKHHTRLEWMIIALILIEVIFETVHYLDRYSPEEEPMDKETIDG